jgi:hypothetical protein
MAVLIIQQVLTPIGTPRLTTDYSRASSGSAVASSSGGGIHLFVTFNFQNQCGVFLGDLLSDLEGTSIKLMQGFIDYPVLRGVRFIACLKGKLCKEMRVVLRQFII